MITTSKIHPHLREIIMIGHIGIDLNLLDFFRKGYETFIKGMKRGGCSKIHKDITKHSINEKATK